MSIETGVLLAWPHWEVIHWHLPQGRSSGYLPDSRDLWDVIWENRAKVWGFAHSHPGSGITGPSYEDLTTFADVEAALGRRLYWPIITSDSEVFCKWKGPARLDYVTFRYDSLRKTNPAWLAELRRLSYDL